MNKMVKKLIRLFSGVIKFCPKTGRPVKALNKWILPVFSIIAFLWIVFRVIPKPQRVTYPCMKVAIPFALPIFVYFGSLWASVVLFKKSFRKFAESKYMFAVILLLMGISFSIVTIFTNKQELFANEFETEGDYDYIDPLGPNKPIGEAKGIFPGRVIWVHNKDATNENCKPYNYNDEYFLEKNANQTLVDEMLTTAILKITGADTEENAWSAIFTYFNSTHNKGEVGYSPGEKIFIKINAVHAWNTEADLSIRKYDDKGNKPNDYGKVDTSPHAILAVLRQLVNKAGIPEDAIYIGDPMTDIFKHLHDKLYTEFPGIHYMSDENHAKREKLQYTNNAKLNFSDKGSVLSTLTNGHFDCVVNADYILNIPAMKGHRGAGVTFFAKNHFGTHTEETASLMHAGSAKNSGRVRGDYKMYRVFVDLMAYKHLGGKTLIYIGDFLWGTSMEHDYPVKFRSVPFNNDWSSSLLVSMDPVAISSVGLDIFQEEFQEEEENENAPRHKYVKFTAVDDYMHQAASSDWWPDGIAYDPDGSGTPISSLGVHEHWNNPVDKKYSKNLGTGEGIELIYLNPENGTSTGEQTLNNIELKTYLSNGNSVLNIRCNKDIPENVTVRIFDVSGKIVQLATLENVMANIPTQINLKNYRPGYYIMTMNSTKVTMRQTIRIN